MIRPVTPDDTPTLVALTAETGFFKPLEIDALREVLDDYHAENAALGHRAFAWEEGGRVLGYVYHAPTPMTDRTWYLYWIAVGKNRRPVVTSGRRGRMRRPAMLPSSAPTPSPVTTAPHVPAPPIECFAIYGPRTKKGA